MPQPRQLSSSYGSDLDSMSVSADAAVRPPKSPDHVSRSTVRSSSESIGKLNNKTPNYQPYQFSPRLHRNLSDASSVQTESRAEHGASDFSDFQQSPESGSDSFQEDSYYSRGPISRFTASDSEVGGGIMAVKVKEKTSLQKDFEDSLRKDRKANLMKIHQTFIKLWQTASLCDIIIKCSDTQIPVHSAVVVGHSGLCEKETRDFHSANTFPIIITLSGNQQLRALRQVVEFMYLAKLEIELASLVSIQAAASELEVYVVTARCNKILERLLDDQNIVQTIQLTAELGIEDLQKVAWTKFTKGFRAFYSRPMFLEQNLQTVTKVLSSDHFGLTSEFEAFEAAMAWMNHKRSERLNYLPRLMDCVRLINMSGEELINCMQYDEAFSSSPGLEILAEANMNKMLKERDELPLGFLLPKRRTKSTEVAESGGKLADPTNLSQAQSLPVFKATNKNIWHPTANSHLGLVARQRSGQLPSAPGRTENSRAYDPKARNSGRNILPEY